jgi:hypothetical protein
MRHGRKSSSKRFNGFKSHIAMDIDTDLILACAVMPANRPEEEGVALLRDDLAIPSHDIREVFIDRGYMASTDVRAMADAGRTVVCKPWAQPNGPLFPKSAFLIDVRRNVITCPNGKRRAFEPGTTIQFTPSDCRQCPKRSLCAVVPSITDARSESQKMSLSSRSSEKRSLLRPDANSYASVSSSSIALLTSRASRGRALATAARARISSMCGATLPSSTSRPSSASRNAPPLEQTVRCCKSSSVAEETLCELR